MGRESPSEPWPGAAHDVYVEMVDLLPALSPGIDDDAKTAVRIGPAALLDGQLGSQDHDLPEQRRVFRADLCHRRDMPLRHDHEMHWRPRRNVVEGEEFFILVDLARGNLALDDLAKDAVRVRGH